MQAGLIVEALRPEKLLCWPPDKPVVQAMVQAAELSLARGAVVTSALASDASINQELMVAQPIDLKDASLGAVAVVIVVSAPLTQHAALSQWLGWSLRWLHWGFSQELQAGQAGSAVGRVSVDEWLRSAANETMDTLAQRITTDLAKHYDCALVALALRQGQQLRLCALSNRTVIDQRQRAVQQVQEVLAQFDVGSGATSFGLDSDKTPAANLSKQYDGADVFCAPLRQVCAGVDDGVSIGALVFVGARGDTDESVMAHLGPAVEQVSAVVGLKRGAQEHVSDRLIHAFQRSAQSPLLKAVCAAAVLLVLGLLLVTGDYRVRADAVVEGRVQRAVVAPFDGYVDQALRRAGDVVSEGETIAQLQSRELQLERQQLDSQRQSLDKAYRQALAGLDHAQAGIFQSQISQVNADLALVRQRLDRTTLSSPIAGIIIRGDLSRSLGAPVEKGQVLFEVAPLKAYRVALYINEKDIGDIQKGQRGVLSLTALPGERIHFVVDNIALVFNERGESAVFRTEAIIAGDVERLRPGMEGVGKVVVGRRSYGSIAFGDAINWWRIRLWSWLP